MTKTVLTYSQIQHKNKWAMEINHSKGQALLVHVARILVVEHVIQRRNLPICIGDLWRA